MTNSVLRLGNSDDYSRKFEVLDGTEGRLPGARYWLIVVLLLAALFRLWRLDRNGYGNRYYSAGVRSMLEGWHNFFFNSFDPAGFVSLDKPPVAFWIQVLSAKVLGFSGVSVLLPQAAEGVAAVAVLYGMVRRSFGPRAGLIAAFFLAITPISIADDRSSNADSCLVLVLLLAAWALLGAARTGRRGLLLTSAILLGIGFNVKMLAAFIVLPVFIVIYVVYAPQKLGRRLVDMTIAGNVLAVVSLSWTAAYDLTAPDQRPFVGSTVDNSMMELVLGHNGFQRFVHHSSPRPETTQAAPTQQASEVAAEASDSLVPPGPFRLLDPRLSSQIGWFLPLVVLGGWLMLQQGATRIRADSAFWLGWLVIYGAVYSGLTRVPPYYLNTLVPAVAALAGIGCRDLWSGITDRSRGLLWLSAMLLSIAVWQVYIESGFFRQEVSETDANATAPEQPTGLMAAVVLGAGLTVAGVAAARSLDPRVRPRLVLASQIFGSAAFLLNPLVWALGGVETTNNVARPQVNPSALLRPTPDTARAWGDASSLGDSKLVAFLEANRGDARFLLATLSARQAAPVIIRTGEPVAALGGFSGTDPIVTPQTLARMVDQKQVRFVMLGGARMNGFGTTAGGADGRTAIEDWVRQHGTPVDPERWRDYHPDNPPFPRTRRRPSNAALRPAPTELYDLALAGNAPTRGAN